MRKRTSTISRFFRRGLIISGLLFFSLGVYHFVEPVGFRSTVFQPAREVLFLENELEPLSHWDKIDVIDIPPGKRVIISAVGGNDVKIVADLRVPERTGNAPALLLLHGSTPWGRKNGLIQYLSYRLSKEGWVVLAPDQRGFGETEDPQDVNDPVAWDVKDDIAKCIDYLLSNPLVDRSRVYVLGHSMGAGYALETALKDSRVRGLILIGPPRSVNGNGQEKVTDWARTRFSADRGLNEPVESHLFAAIGRQMDIAEFSKGVLSRPGHKPILLIDGENEGTDEKIFLGEVASRISPPLMYVTLPGTGHYIGVYNLFGSRRVYYRPDLLDPFMKVFNEFTSGIPFNGEKNG